MSDINPFDLRPAVRSHRLNVLPRHEEGTERGRFPSWLHRSLPKLGLYNETSEVIKQQRLHTVCEEAKCPNRFECWSRHAATFLIMGAACTRACGFCDIATTHQPPPLDPSEPDRVAASAAALKLQHVVITMVARDDCNDGGVNHLVTTVLAVRSALPNSSIEVLTSDFGGLQESWQQVLACTPSIWNHNVETVRRLTPRVRHKATYERSLALLRYASNCQHSSIMFVKSGLMVGLGEKEEEVCETLRDLQEAGCAVVTIGQYLQPSQRKLLVKDFISPEQFERYAEYGRSIGIPYVYASPFMRSSYNAEAFFSAITTASRAEQGNKATSA